MTIFNQQPMFHRDPPDVPLASRQLSTNYDCVDKTCCIRPTTEESRREPLKFRRSKETESTLKNQLPSQITDPFHSLFEALVTVRCLTFADCRLQTAD